MNIFQKTGGLLNAALALLTGVLVHVKPAVKVVNIIKEAVKLGELTGLFAALQPKEWDSTQIARIRGGVYDLVQALNLPEVTQDSKQSDFRNQLGDLVAFIRDQPEAHRSALYAKTASTLAQKLSGGQLTEAEADTLVQLHYAQTKTAA